MIDAGKLTYEQCLWISNCAIDDIEKICDKQDWFMLGKRKELVQELKIPMSILEQLNEADYELSFDTYTMREVWRWWHSIAKLPN